jgi:hypothetical protein
MTHNKYQTQIYFADMLLELTRISFWRIFKRWKQLKKIDEFAKQHNKCCELDWEIKQ